MEISGISSVEADTAMLAAPLSSANRYFAERPFNDKLDRTRSPRGSMSRVIELPGVRGSCRGPHLPNLAVDGRARRQDKVGKFAEPRLERDAHFHTRQVERMQRWGKSPPPELSIRRS
jgi:hypothetical protein